LARLDIDVPAIRVWGDEYRRIGRAESDYHTLAGTVRVMRTVYRKTERNGDTLDPVSVRVVVVADGWLPHTARAMAYLIAQGTSREAEATGRELARLPYSRSSFERVGHEVGTLYRRAQEARRRRSGSVRRASYGRCRRRTATARNVATAQYVVPPRVREASRVAVVIVPRYAGHEQCT
jgi:hypothetical protein